jgi:hypothetical protein
MWLFNLDDDVFKNKSCIEMQMDCKKILGCYVKNLVEHKTQLLQSMGQYLHINTRTFSHSDNVNVIMSNYLLVYPDKSNLWVMKDQLILISLSMSPLVIILAISTITNTHPQLSWNFCLEQVGRAIPPYICVSQVLNFINYQARKILKNLKESRVPGI